MKIKSKEKFNKKGWSWLIAIIMVVGMATGCSTEEAKVKTDAKVVTAAADTTKAETPKAEVTTEVKGELKVHYIDVGQADSILLQQGSNSMLIDAGNNADSELVKKYIADQGITNLDFLVGTHPHEDHIGGLDYVINSFKIGKIYMPKAISTTKTFQDVVNAIKNKGMKATVPTPGESFKLGEATCTILAPNGTGYKDTNNDSIVIKVSFGGNSFLFTGDAEDVSENEMLSKNYDLKADVLKVGHHGSKSSTTQGFLDKVSPKYAVVSVGKGNDYGHPVQSTMDKFKNKNIAVYRTDENGSIIATSNGKDVSFNVKPASYNGAKEKVAAKTTANNSESVSNAKVVAPKPIQEAAPEEIRKTTPEPIQETAPKQTNSGGMVWLSATGDKYHSINNCGRMNPNKARQVTLDEAKNSYSPCSKCSPPQ
ncbi:MBL fold metallo-hydrolase [Clostridium estertheticum]|uniref:ComEC/Rec2 family competence protein n=1 Tax=Clostridium estertheticum TaxID=238834 RepID=UPI001CCA5123|nr:ComEC/Rec2 family competence protein [Clostridium estertheticum]MBZ9608614.1 MBL fold metallo-hydrolase [Clostridium estertheticum]